MAATLWLTGEWTGIFPGVRPGPGESGAREIDAVVALQPLARSARTGDCEVHALIKGRSSVEIARPVETVYDFVVVRFFENYPRWSPEVRELRAISDGPVRLGTRGRQVRVDHGRRSETTFEVTRLEPERAVDFDGDRQARFAIRYRFEANGAQSSTLHLEFELKQLDLFMRPFEKLIRHAIQEGTDKTVRDIKGLIEREN